MTTEGGSEEFVADGHAEILLGTMNEFRTDEEFCDVVIEVEGTKFPCHKCIVAGVIPFFKTMFLSSFKEAKLEHVPVTGVDSRMMHLILSYAYTGRVPLTVDNAKDLIKAADYLGVTAVRNAASKFLYKNVSDNNCLEIYILADLSKLEDLRQLALRRTRRNFGKLSKREEFLALSQQQLTDILDSEDLVSPDEEFLFRTIMRWYSAKPENKGLELHLVMEKIRLRMLDASFLRNCAKYFPVLNELPDVMKLITCAKVLKRVTDDELDACHTCAKVMKTVSNDELYACHSLLDRSSSKTILQSVPRKSSSNYDAIVITGGISNGKIDKEVLCYLPIANTWRKLPSCPTTRPYKVCAHKNQIIAIEYCNSENASWWRYNAEEKLWIQMALSSAPLSRFFFSEVFLLVSNDIYCYAVTKDYTQPSTVMEFAITMNHIIQEYIFEEGLVVHDDCTIIAPYREMLYFADTQSRTFFRSNFITKTKSILPSMSAPKKNVAGCALNGYIYLIGGVSSNNQVSNTVERYDIDNNKWQLISSMKKPRCRHGVVAICGKVFVIGGETENNQQIDSVECYDPRINAWEIVTKLPTPRSNFSCTILKIQKELTEEIEDCSE